MESLLDAYNDFNSYSLTDIKNDFPNFMGALSFFVEQICNADVQKLKDFFFRGK